MSLLYGATLVGYGALPWTLWVPRLPSTGPEQHERRPGEPDWEARAPKVVTLAPAIVFDFMFNASAFDNTESSWCHRFRGLGRNPSPGSRFRPRSEGPMPRRCQVEHAANRQMGMPPPDPAPTFSSFGRSRSRVRVGFSAPTGSSQLGSDIGSKLVTEASLSSIHQSHSVAMICFACRDMPSHSTAFSSSATTS